MRWLGILGVWMYRWFLRPFMQRRCLYGESCSTYALRLLHEQGLLRAVPQIRHRVRSCRMPAAACFVLGSDGVPQLISATGHDGAAAPPGALRVLALDAVERTRHVPPVGAG